jgi:hypothetical protein
MALASPHAPEVDLWSDVRTIGRPQARGGVTPVALHNVIDLPRGAQRESRTTEQLGIIAATP